MNKHDHHDCEHVLKFCAPCNEAYCTKCEAVWASEPCTRWHADWSYTYPGITTTAGTRDDVHAYSHSSSHSAC